jgi:hypothetical protein
MLDNMRFAHQRAGELLAAVMADFERAYDRFGSHSVIAGATFEIAAAEMALCFHMSDHAA